MGSKNKQDSEFEKKWWAVSKGDLRSSLRDDETVGKEGIMLLQKKLNRRVYKEIARHRYASEIGTEGKNWLRKRKEELKMTRQTGGGGVGKAGVEWLFETIWRETRGCSRACGGPKPQYLTGQAKAEEDRIKNTSQEEKQGKMKEKDWIWFAFKKVI